jgi:phosphoglycerate kinase
LQAAGAKIVILSHFGRPDGQRNEKYSLRPVASALADILKNAVAFADDCIGPVAQRAVDTLQKGQILVLENTRFYAGEEENDPTFAAQMAALGDVFINDAFSAAHRAHASTEGLAHLLPCAAGRLMQEELTALGKALEHPERPVAAIVGGSKISTKLDLLRNLIAKVDVLVLGGGMANTFMAARGLCVGKSLYEADMLETARTISAEAEKSGCAIILPRDVVVAAEIKEGLSVSIVAANSVPEDLMILDIGAQAAEDISARLSACKTMIWNGPLGVFETKPFDAGTNAVARTVADLTAQGKILSVAGGGDTVAALANAGLGDAMSYVSTAGGAFLEWMEGKALPGVVALTPKA